jgi:hypothetical protein
VEEQADIQETVVMVAAAPVLLLNCQLMAPAAGAAEVAEADLVMTVAAVVEWGYSEKAVMV